MVFGQKLKMLIFVPLERAPTEQQIGATFSFVAPSSEELVNFDFSKQ